MWKASSSCISRSRRRRRVSLRMKANISELLRRSGERGAHRVDELLPSRGLLAQSLASCGGQAVELGAAIVFGRAPFGVEQSLHLQAVQRWIERALFDIERAVGDLPDAQQHAVTVKRSERDGFEDQQIEGSGKE